MASAVRVTTCHIFYLDIYTYLSTVHIYICMYLATYRFKEIVMEPHCRTFRTRSVVSRDPVIRLSSQLRLPE